MEPQISKRIQTIVTIVLAIILMAIIGLYIYIGMRQVTQPAVEEVVEGETAADQNETWTEVSDQMAADAALEEAAKQITEKTSESSIPLTDRALILEEMSQNVAPIVEEGEVDTIEPPVVTPADERIKILEQAQDLPPIEITD